MIISKFTPPQTFGAKAPKIRVPLSAAVLISPEEANSLAYRARRGSKPAQNDLLVAYGNYIHKLAANFSHRFSILDADDLAQAGNLGLMDAASRYERGKNFKNYAPFRIRGSMLQAVREEARVRRLGLHKNAQRIQNTVQEAIEELTTETSEPTIEQLAAKLELSPITVAGAIKHKVGGGLSLDELIEDNAGMAEISSAAGVTVGNPFQQAASAQLQRILDKAIDEGSLTQKELRALIMRYMVDSMQLKVIGRKLSVSESRVSQLITSALGKLKEGMYAGDLHTFLEG